MPGLQCNATFGGVEPVNLARLISVAELAELKTAGGSQLFPESTVRGWMHDNLDGFRDRCVVRLGQRVMVDLDALDAWLEERRGTRTRKPRSGRRLPTRQPKPLKPWDQIRREAGLA